MKPSGAIFRTLFIGSVFLISGAYAHAQEGEVEAAKGILMRLLPNHADRFTLELIPAEDQGLDVFELESAHGKIVIRGSSGIAIASGLNWYLKYRCNCNISWCGNNLKLPDPLPKIENKVRNASPYKLRNYMNYCTHSYSAAWWDWPRWEREIDWMALNGINFPLAITGQEAIWQSVYRKMGLTDEQIGKFMVGPAYFAWGWMGNIDGWLGPLPQSWIDGQRELQRKILARERELGMKPILPAFTGHVPAAIREKFPRAKIKSMNWGVGFGDTYMLDPTDGLFDRIGKAFLEEQTNVFGADHFYTADTFNENPPPTNDPAWLKSASKKIFDTIAQVDPQARLVVQGWMFHFAADFWKPAQVHAYLDGVPGDRMIVLDLHCDADPQWKKHEAFYGKPWVWCFIHNFGGRNGLYGNIDFLATEPPNVLKAPNCGNITGFGLLMEGIEQNPVFYDLATDMIWRTEPVDMNKWIADYATRRYGQSNPAALKAWEILHRTCYRSPYGTLSGGTIFACRPGLKNTASWAVSGIQYNHADVREAWKQLQSCQDRFRHVDSYRYDLIDVGRQVLANVSERLMTKVNKAIETGNAQELAKAGARFEQVLLDIDELLATRQEFLLGRWLESAKRKGTTPAEKELYELNARTLITLWGDAKSPLHEYSHRQWSGLIRDFYLPRWRQYFNARQEHFKNNKPFDNQAFWDHISLWEEGWTKKRNFFADKPAGDPVAVSEKMLRKYRELWPNIYGEGR